MATHRGDTTRTPDLPARPPGRTGPGAADLRRPGPGSYPAPSA
ncbi:hypothetical protein KPATCC21470_4180 [Kitasatospora purpeofusca]